MYMKNYKMSYSYRYHIHSFLWHPFFGLCFTHCNYVRSDDVRNFKGEAHSVSTIVSDNSGIKGSSSHKRYATASIPPRWENSSAIR